jgi:hypothetical protein
MDGIMAADSPSELVKVNTTAITSILAAFEVFLAEGNGWSIRSSVPTENFVPVVAGWMDNSFDTQRSRGTDATVRIVFPD